MFRNRCRLLPVLAFLVPASVAATDARAPAVEDGLLQQLGSHLFFDTSLSSPPGQSCATCHDPAAAFADPDVSLPTSKGVIPGRVGSRNTPSGMYAAFSPPFGFDPKEELYVGGQFWDGRASSLEEQAKGPFLNPLEMANPDARTVVDKVRVSGYAALFEQVFGKNVFADVDRAYAGIATAIAAFERSPRFSPFSSKFDLHLAGKVKLSDQELLGLRLFEDANKGTCAACHPSRPGPKGEPPLFTDFTYDNLGVPRNPDNPYYRLPAEFNPDGAAFVDRGLGGFVSKATEDGKFKVPTLRNVALTAPYMHNGYFRTLEAVTAFYNDRDVRPRCAEHGLGEADALRHGCWPAPEVATNVNRQELGRLGLAPEEVLAIVAFMRTLTDGYRP